MVHGKVFVLSGQSRVDKAFGVNCWAEGIDMDDPSVQQP
jgi:hypothetical protein